MLEEIASKTVHKDRRSSRFVSYRAKMLGEFDSRKDSYPTKFKRRLRILLKLNFRELRDSKLSGLRPFDNMEISLS